MKKYIANTAIGISVALQGGGYTRVSFCPLSDGSSVYYTDDKEIQWALEHHYKFGKLFRLAEETEEQSAPAKKATAKATAKKTQGKSAKKQTAEKEQPSAEENTEEADEGSNDKQDESEEDEEAQEGGTEQREVTVTDMDDAKDYLAENFGVVRTKLKSEEIIKETALSYGIVFKTL